jgi:hypothetical protein
MPDLLTRKSFLRMAAGAVCAARAAKTPSPQVLDPEAFRHYIDEFNGILQEDFANYIPDAPAWQFLKANIPFFTCPDHDVEQICLTRVTGHLS